MPTGLAPTLAWQARVRGAGIPGCSAGSLYWADSHTQAAGDAPCKDRSWAAGSGERGGAHVSQVGDTRRLDRSVQHWEATYLHSWDRLDAQKPIPKPTVMPCEAAAETQCLQLAMHGPAVYAL
jgi:hypothetical protein